MLLLQLILQRQGAFQDCAIISRPRVPSLVLDLLHADLASLGRNFTLVLTATDCCSLFFEWLLLLVRSLVVAEHVHVLIIID